MFRKKILSEPFFQNIKPLQLPPIELHHRMRYASCRHASRPKEFAREKLIKVARILHRVIQVDLPQPMKPLVRIKLVKTQRKSRLRIVDLAETSRRTFKVKSNIPIDVVPFEYSRSHVFSAVLLERSKIGFAQLYLDLHGKPVRKEIRGGKPVLRRVSRFGGPKGRWKKDQTARKQSEEKSPHRIHRG